MSDYSNILTEEFTSEISSRNVPTSSIYEISHALTRCDMLLLDLNESGAYGTSISSKWTASNIIEFVEWLKARMPMYNDAMLCEALSGHPIIDEYVKSTMLDRCRDMIRKVSEYMVNGEVLAPVIKLALSILKKKKPTLILVYSLQEDDGGISTFYIPALDASTMSDSHITDNIMQCVRGKSIDKLPITDAYVVETVLALACAQISSESDEGLGLSSVAAIQINNDNDKSIQSAGKQAYDASVSALAIVQGQIVPVPEEHLKYLLKMDFNDTGDTSEPYKIAMYDAVESADDELSGSNEDGESVTDDNELEPMSNPRYDNRLHDTMLGQEAGGVALMFGGLMIEIANSVFALCGSLRKLPSVKYENMPTPVSFTGLDGKSKTVLADIGGESLTDIYDNVKSVDDMVPDQEAFHLIDAIAVEHAAFDLLRSLYIDNTRTEITDIMYTFALDMGLDSRDVYKYAPMIADFAMQEDSQSQFDMMGDMYDDLPESKRNTVNYFVKRIGSSTSSDRSILVIDGGTDNIGDINNFASGNRIGIPAGTDIYENAQSLKQIRTICTQCLLSPSSTMFVSKRDYNNPERPVQVSGVSWRNGSWSDYGEEHMFDDLSETNIGDIIGLYDGDNVEYVKISDVSD